MGAVWKKARVRDYQYGAGMLEIQFLEVTLPVGLISHCSWLRPLRIMSLFTKPRQLLGARRHQHLNTLVINESFISLILVRIAYNKPLKPTAYAGHALCGKAKSAPPYGGLVPPFHGQCFESLPKFGNFVRK